MKSFENPEFNPQKPKQGVEIIDPNLKKLGIKIENFGPNAEALSTLESLIPGIKTDENIFTLDHVPKDTEKFKSLEKYDLKVGHKIFDSSDFGLMYDDFSRFMRGYLFGLIERKPEALNELRDKFKGKIIVDIGAGEGSSTLGSNGYIIARLLEAKGYIAVEPFNWKQLTGELLRSGKKTKKPEGDLDVMGYYKGMEIVDKQPIIPFNIVVEDALNFLKRLPDDSVALLSSGLDKNILQNDDYETLLSLEMNRVLASNSYCIHFGESVKPTNTSIEEKYNEFKDTLSFLKKE